jgi:PAS domain S-box-containing protein
MVESKEEHKIMVMATLVGICCVLTYYFHAVRETGVVFTHFFYIPIILAALWWRRKGLVVALFLTALLLFSHFFVRPEWGTVNDLIRAPMFIVIGLIVAILSERIAKAEEKIKRKNILANIIATVPDSLVVLDTDLRIKEANRSFYEKFQTEPDELIGSGIAEVLGDKGGKLSSELPELFGTEDMLQNFELHYQSEKLGERIFDITARGIFREEEELVVLKDVTEHKQMDEERERLLKELETKNSELERFTYTVSHDLRSPLISVQGFAHLVREDLEQGKTEDLAPLLEYIETAAIKMDRLITDTLQLSRIGRVANPPEDVPFGALVQEAQEQTQEQIKSRGVEVTVAEDFPAVHVDRMRIAEVLVNLITNSIKYMGEQRHPKIDIGYRLDGKETVFFVQDNGMGIDKSQHEKVFELFYKVDGSSNGTGAGLAIVKRITEVHEGRIWIESEEGKGCTVCFTLPVHRKQT